MKNLIYILTFIIWGCSSNVSEPTSEFIDEIKTDTISDNIENEQENDVIKESTSISLTKNDSIFLNVYDEIVMAISQHDSKKFNSYIFPNYGIYFIESNGALPNIKKIYTIDDFKSLQENKSIYQLFYHEVDEAPIFDTLPKIICGGEVYDKYGCFAQPTNPLNESQIWNYTDLNDKQKQAIELLVNTITYTVVNTANFTFYFSLIENKWYITFIDIRTPCSA